MQNIITAVLAGLTSAIVVMGGYHLLVAAPRWRRLQAVLDSYDSLLGGGGASRATERLAALDRAAAEAAAERAEVETRLAALERVARCEVARIGFVRYNAFSDVGSDLSYALALLNRDGNGVVLSSIYSREDTRTYGKAVTAFKPAQDPSEEELAAIAEARAAAS
jgi:hypothetical protein